VQWKQGIQLGNHIVISVLCMSGLVFIELLGVFMMSTSKTIRPCVLKYVGL